MKLVSKGKFLYDTKVIFSRRRKKSKSKLAKTAPYMEEGVLLIDKHFSIEVLSSVTSRLLKLEANQKFFTYSEDLQSPILDKIILMIKGNKLSERVKLDDIMYSLQLIDDGKKGSFIAVIKDTTSIEKALHMGKEFVGNASHELRTPITIIKGFTEMLLESEQIQPSMQRSILEKIAASTARMEHLVNHLLRLTDLENNELEGVIPANIHELIEDVSYQVLSIHTDFQIEHLRKEEDLFCLVEPDLIELVLINLCKNCVKYSREEKVIEIKVDREDSYVYIKITDKGIGIPEKDLVNIFDRFYTVDKAHCRKLGGAGLGLSIVKLIVEKHKGKIYATSELGKSTSMHVYLPLAKTPASVGLAQV